MAKTSMVNREDKRAKLVKRYAAKRAKLKDLLANLKRTYSGAIGRSKNGKPNTDTLDAMTTRVTPNVAAACSTLNVAITFVRKTTSGTSWVGRGMAAR